MKVSVDNGGLRRLGTWLAVLIVVSGGISFAGENGGGLCIKFDTSLTDLNLSGGPFPLPLASDPGNLLGDSIDGYGFVDCEVNITLSSQRTTDPGPASPGMAFAFHEGPATKGIYECGEDEIDPVELDGDTFFVDSFFDVFFDITVTDVDPRPGRDIAGAVDGSSLSLVDNGPAHMQSFYILPFDAAAPNFGLVPPPESDPYIGHFSIEIPLGGDINGNGEPDKIKFTLASHSAGDENRQFIVLPDGTVLDEFDSAAFLEGAIVDESTDPPFTIGMIDPATGLADPDSFGGPTTATSRLVNPTTDSDGDGVPDGEDECPASDLSPTVVIDQCDTRVENILLPSGCTISDLIAAIAAEAENHGDFVSGVAALLNELKREGLINGREKGAIQSCAARASIP